MDDVVDKSVLAVSLVECYKQMKTDELEDEFGYAGFYYVFGDSSANNCAPCKTTAGSTYMEGAKMYKWPTYQLR